MGISLACRRHKVQVIGVIQTDSHELFAGDGLYAFGCFVSKNKALAFGCHQITRVRMIIQRLHCFGRIHTLNGREVFQLLSVYETQYREQDCSAQCSNQYKGGTASQTASAFVGDCAEQGQHKQCQDIVQRHDDTAVCL